MSYKKVLVTVFMGIFAQNTLAQSMWDIRQVSASNGRSVQLKLPSGATYTEMPVVQAKEITEIVDKFSLLSGIYPTVYLKESDAFNAYASNVDGRPIVVINKPMYDVLIQDKAMTAALLGHEMAHLYFKHGEKRADAAQAGEVLGLFVGTLLEIFFIGRFGVTGIGANVGGAVEDGVKGANTRPQESEADRQGMIWAIQAGYDPYGAPRLFKEMEKRGGNSFLPFLNSHPNPADRFDSSVAIADLYKKYKNLEVVDSPELLALNEKIDAYWQKQLPKSDAAIAGVTAYSKKDYVAAIKNFQICSQSGEATCTNNLGVIYLFGFGVPQDKTKALGLFKNASEQGSPVAKINYARAILRGEEGVIDMPKAIKYVAESANDGVPDAMGTMASFGLIEGLRPEISQYIPEKETLVLYAKASAMRGDDNGTYSLASMSLRGYGMPKNVDYAETLLNNLYRKGNLKANGPRYYLYALERNNAALGEEIKKEMIDKKQLQSLSNVMGYYCFPNSQYKNSEKCFEWVGYSAKTGNVGAAYSYGIFKYQGTGTEKDEIEGAAWVNYARSKGWQLAIKAAENYQSKFSPEEMAKIQKRTIEIQETLQKN